MPRAVQRALCSVVGIIAGVLMALFGKGYVLGHSYPPGRGLPLPYFGYFLAGLGVLGLVGVNVFIGGPLDKRFDEPDVRVDKDFDDPDAF